MGYLTDGPPELKPMIDVIKDFGQYRFDPADIFQDFINYCIGCFLLHGDQETATQLRKKYGDDYDKFYDLFAAWITLMSKEMAKKEWYDALGLLYEYLASSGKKSALGQFFTPEGLCDLLTFINTPATAGTGKIINDPACGSGRTLLSYNAILPNNYFFGEDLDPICAKMAALNFAVHGIQGQITCMDTLGQNQWKFCFQSNRLHSKGGPPIPHLERISFDNSRNWYNQIRSSAEKENKAEIIEYKIEKNGQLTMF